jgi:hypothetical protein
MTTGATSMAYPFELTARQVAALKAARDKGGAVYGRGRAGLMGGAYRRMCERLAERGLVEDRPPFPITDAGRAALYANE